MNSFHIQMGRSSAKSVSMPIGRRPATRLTATQQLTARGIGVVTGAVLLASMLGVWTTTPPIEQDHGVYGGTIALAHLGSLAGALDSTRFALEAAHAELDRARLLIAYSGRYNIPADLAALIYDTALEEGIDPLVAFRLVYVESRFDPRAKSTAGALGLAQVQPATARYFKPDLQPHELYDSALNLRIGFRYLQDLISAFDGDLALALTAYNRGPGRLRQLLAGGIAPWNGYAAQVLDGFQPTTVIAKLP